MTATATDGGLSQAQQSFLDTYSAYAQLAETKTGVPWQTILAQWADETGWGQAPAFANGFNFAGVSPGGRVAVYPDLMSGLAAYVATLTQPIYATVRNAAPQGPVAAAQALGASPWAASHYNDSGGGPGSDLVAILDETGLASTSATLTGYNPGQAFLNNLDPGLGLGLKVGGSVAGDIATKVADDLISAVKKPALGALFLVLAAGLVGAGIWRAAKPVTQPIEDKARQGAQIAAVAA